ncbi:hypothetical protein CVT24_011786 [Panaeolus cyanescens]|uniref:Uncharacterized protein n=1 Tax=Panaeolus cyanescens TaxID=181874 RepID=A0A409WDU4_9AGAR|nr:hypothetical protein CVT24_011786 [Panaeolus cyanescens]
MVQSPTASHSSKQAAPAPAPSKGDHHDHDAHRAPTMLKSVTVHANDVDYNPDWMMSWATDLYFVPPSCTTMARSLYPTPTPTKPGSSCGSTSTVNGTSSSTSTATTTLTNTSKRSNRRKRAKNASKTPSKCSDSDALVSIAIANLNTNTSTGSDHHDDSGKVGTGITLTKSFLSEETQQKLFFKDDTKTLKSTNARLEQLRVKARLEKKGPGRERDGPQGENLSGDGKSGAATTAMKEAPHIANEEFLKRCQAKGIVIIQPAPET